MQICVTLCSEGNGRLGDLRSVNRQTGETNVKRFSNTYSFAVFPSSTGGQSEVAVSCEGAEKYVRFTTYVEPDETSRIVCTDVLNAKDDTLICTLEFRYKNQKSFVLINANKQ